MQFSKIFWSHNIIFAKDFIETAKGLIFAVVAQGTEQGKALCFLRYVKRDAGWEKVATSHANAFLEQHYPEYLHYSQVLDAHLHAVAVDRIVTHHRPKQRKTGRVEDRLAPVPPS